MNLIDRIKKMPLGIKIACSAAVVAVIAAIVVAIVLSRNGYIAYTMRLLRVEGTVTIEDSKGGTKPVIDNIRFQSGDALSTGSDGIASVGLDDTKIITLQSDSRAEFTKQGKHLELKLTKGAVFFNVTEKLQPDETFEIKTSTMTAGIRGTSGIVYYDEESNRDALIVTDGSVVVTATNPDTGETKYAEVKGGERIQVFLYSDRKEDTVQFYLDEITEEDLSDFTLEMLVENDELLNRVCEYTGWDKEKLKSFVNDVSSGKVTGQVITLTPTPTSTVTPTPSTSPTPTVTVTPTPSPTDNPNASPTPVPDPDPDATSTPTPTVTVTPTPTATTTPSPSATPTEKPTPTEEPIEYTFVVKDKLYEDDNGERTVNIRRYSKDGEYEYEGLVDGEWVPLIYESWSEEASGGDYYYLASDTDMLYYCYEWEDPDPYQILIDDKTYDGRDITIRYCVIDESTWEYEGLYNGEWVSLINQSESVGSRGIDRFFFADNPEKLYYYNEWTNPEYDMPYVEPQYTYLLKDVSYQDRTVSIRYYTDADGIRVYSGLVEEEWVPLRYYQSSGNAEFGYTDCYEIVSTGELYYSRSSLDFDPVEPPPSQPTG